MSNKIQINTTGQTTLCLRQKIDKTTYLIEVHFNERSTQSVKDRLRRVILHDLEHGKQGCVEFSRRSHRCAVENSPCR